MTPAPTPEAPDPRAASPLGRLNQLTKQRQRMLLAGGASIAALAGLWFVFGGGGTPSGVPAPASIETDGIMNRPLSEREFMAAYGNRLDDQARQLKALADRSNTESPQLQAKLDALAAENQAMKTNGTATIDALTRENATLRDAVTQAQAAQAAPAVRDTTIPSGSPLSPGLGQDGGGGATAAPNAREVKTLSFTATGAPTSAAAGSETPVGLRVSRPQAPALELEDNPDYLPPNSYAPARVVVGVDASAGVASQTDPLPVVLRITGPARSVVQNGRLLTTRLAGCIVNGAARGDLSAEKVYVKLQKMTCDQPGGRVAVSEVKGFISFAGKTGVRGRVVSREGNLVSQALLAGIIGGFGRGFAANANGVFSGLATGVDGKAQTLSGGDIVRGGLGQGIGDASDTVSKYLIERAEQYQPVVEMPTGIDVEIVFLDGVYVRNSQ